MTKSPEIIGRSEEIQLVDYDLAIPAKIDTGAYNSSIHFNNAELINQSGKELLRAKLLGHPSSPHSFMVETEDFEIANVKNSFGVREVRYKIKLRVKLGTKTLLASFTLADRSNNLMPVLIGRELLGDNFLVDITKAGVNRVKLRKIYNDNTGRK
jgi:hypothetical protein